MANVDGYEYFQVHHMQLEVTVGYNHDVANESKYMHIAETWGGGNLELVSFHYEPNWTQVAFAPPRVDVPALG